MIVYGKSESSLNENYFCFRRSYVSPFRRSSRNYRTPRPKDIKSSKNPNSSRLQKAKGFTTQSQRVCPRKLPGRGLNPYRRRFFPSRKMVKNMITRVKAEIRTSKIDQENIENLKDIWQRSADVHFSPR